MTYIKQYNSPIGLINIISDGDFLIGLYFENSKDAIKHKINSIKKDLPIFNETFKWLDTYFSGKNPNFTPKYKIESTLFRKQVIDIMNKIPYGQTITYNDIAKEIAKNQGKEKMSAQAVGGAVGWNPICIIVPCHRVVGANGNLTGYGGGLDKKIELLKTEGINTNNYYIPKKITKEKKSEKI